MFSTLRNKLILSYLALIVLAMGLSAVLLLSFLERYFVEATEESLIAQARIAVQTLIPGAVAIGPSGAEELPSANILQQRQVGNYAVQTDNLSLPETAITIGDVDLSYLGDASLQLGSQLTTRLRVVDVEGMVIVDSWGSDAGESVSDFPLVTEALSGYYASQTADVDGVETMTVAVPALVDGALAGVVYLSQPLSDVAAVVRDLRSRLIVSTVIALVLSGIVGLLFSRAITRPLRRLTAAAGTVAQGRFDTEVPIRSRDELGHLSRAFNEMTARLRAARQMQTDFVANVSHELRTPLTSIKGMVETLRAGAVNDLTVRDRFLSTVESETNRLIRLVNDLLLLSRADSEALNLRCEAVDVVQLARVAVDHLAPLADVRDVALRVNAAPDVPLAWADADRVVQVLVNLLDNAVKYSHPGDTVSVILRSDLEQTVLVRVRDTGDGIPADALTRIGERFYRADKARARSQGGSGLGLAIAHSLIAAHRGKLWLESVEGEGTTASFTLPAV